MKRLIIAKNKLQLGIVLVIAIVVITTLDSFIPEDYWAYYRLVYLAWLLLFGWLAWSLIAKLVLSIETVELPKEVDSAFHKFEESLDRLTVEQGKMSRNLQDAVVYQRELSNVLVGFIEQAEHLAGVSSDLASGNMERMAYHDPTLNKLLAHLDDVDRQNTINSEVGILRAQEQAYRVQSRILLNRVVEARGRIAQERVRLNQAEAAQPFLQMTQSLGECEARLHFLDSGLRQPKKLLQ